jgi:hypothetical protein
VYDTKKDSTKNKVAFVIEIFRLPKLNGTNVTNANCSNGEYIDIKNFKVFS